MTDLDRRLTMEWTTLERSLAAVLDLEAGLGEVMRRQPDGATRRVR
jgi:hypothetical protein